MGLFSLRYFPRRGNLFQNPSFEAGREPWSWRSESASWNDFEITAQRAHSGKHSAHLRLENQPGRPLARIWGLIQDPQLRRMPEKIGFWYRVENWRKGTRLQFLQMVVMVSDEFIPATGQQTQQLRYILYGLNEVPYPEEALNVRFLVASPDRPVEGEWIHFEADLRRDFLRTWGKVPEQFKKVEFIFEARYDEHPPEGVALSGDVYWDDFTLSW
ncbi:MAG: hypothetical protein U1F66_09115 [bacterium]